LMGMQTQLLKQEGADVTLSAGDMTAAPLTKWEKEKSYEKVFGQDSYVKYQWYKLGLERCCSVARFETLTGDGMGTGFLLRGADLHPSLGAEFLVLANA